MIDPIDYVNKYRDVYGKIGFGLSDCNSVNNDYWLARIKECRDESENLQKQIKKWKFLYFIYIPIITIIIDSIFRSFS